MRISDWSSDVCSSDRTWVDVDLIEDLAGQKLAAAAAELVVSEGLAFATPVLGTSVPYDLERQLHQYHAPVPPQTPEEEGRLQDLEIENDDLVAALETELADGTPEAAAANARPAARDRAVARAEEGRVGRG